MIAIGFAYGKAQRIIHCGCCFDSLTELKYALSIQDDYHFLRERVKIFYDPATRRPTDYLRDNIRRYTPDFLVRHKKTGDAFLVEIKLRAFNDFQQLELRREIAENYIRWKKYDWKYKIVYDDEIILSANQLKDFKDYRKLKSKSDFLLWFDPYNRKFEKNAPSLFKSTFDPKIIQYVMFGREEQLCLWRS